MDELKINLSSKLMRGIIKRLIAKNLEKKLGYKIDVQLNELKINVIDGMVQLHVDIDGEIEASEFMKIIKTYGLD